MVLTLVVADWYKRSCKPLSNCSDSSSTNANDRIILNGTNGTSANAGDGLMLEQIDITLEGVDSETDVRSETKSGDEEVVEVLLEAGSQETGSDKLALNATDSSATDANDNIKMEDYTSNIACLTQSGSSTGTGLIFNGVTTT